MCLLYILNMRQTLQSWPRKQSEQGVVVTRKADKEHMNRVASIGCILCKHLDLGETPAQLHHIREGQGMSQRASNFLVVPLCPEHHQGNSGVHGLGERGFYTRYKLSELDLLAMTLEALSLQRTQSSPTNTGVARAD
jgi:hypothetical protein